MGWGAHSPFFSGGVAGWTFVHYQILCIMICGSGGPVRNAAAVVQNRGVFGRGGGGLGTDLGGGGGRGSIQRVCELS